MNIVHIITRLIIGGAQENTLLSCQEQHKAGHHVTLITGPSVGPEGSLMQQAQDYGYHVIVIKSMGRAINPWGDWRTYRRLVKLLAGMEPDVVHTHSSKAGILGRWAARRAGARTVVHTIHGLAFTASTRARVNQAYKYLERKTAPLTDRIICVADAMRDQSLAANIGTPQQYVTIYSGMEIEPFMNPPASRDEARGELGISPEHVVMGTIARLFDLKGHDDLLDLASRLCQRFANLRFLWVGDGSLRQKLEARMNQLNLRDRFILTGLVPPSQVPRLTAAMDLLVHPSRREGLARALPQAGLAGIPAITYDIDGAREGVLDGQTGFVIPPFDLDRLCGAIEALLEDGSRRRHMGQAGREFARNRFNVTVMADKLDQLYRDLVSARR